MRGNETTLRAAKPSRGFSLIELLIVVAIILIIAAVAIPNMIRAKIAANESSAASSVRKIATAEYAYNAAYPTQGYAPDLVSLGSTTSTCTPSVTSACILDMVVSTGIKSGYQFSAAGFSPTGGPNSTFVTGSAPQSYNSSGVRLFCIVTDGVLRIDAGSSGAVPVGSVAACSAYAIAQ
jgi:type IV pilus assembly protein PilA